MLRTLVLMAFIGLYAGFGFSQKPKVESVENIISSKDYKIAVDKMMPMGGGMRVLTSDYSVRIANDSIYSYLPYAGEGYSVPYGGGKGLIFDAPLSGYDEICEDDKVIVTAKVRNEEDSFTYTITVYNNGTAYLGVQPVNRRFISFSGTIVAD